MPQVTTPPPTEPKIKQPYRPRTAYRHPCGKDGKPMPSQLEIAEGAAWKEWAIDPASERKANEWNESAFLLMNQQPRPALNRCASCGTRAYGRILAVDGCGHCKHVGPAKYSTDVENIEEVTECVTEIPEPVTNAGCHTQNPNVKSAKLQGQLNFY